MLFFNHKLKGLSLIFIIACLLFKVSSACAQIYQGGNGVGFEQLTRPARTLAFSDSLYNGGSNNGIAFNHLLSQKLGGADSLYNGGAFNGFVSISSSNRNLAINDSLFNGGRGDGFIRRIFANIILGMQDSIFNGGLGSGFYVYDVPGASVYVADSMYNGGSGKGENKDGDLVNLDVNCITGSFWNGNSSNLWGDPANWECGLVPGPGSTVVIRSGLARYPMLFVTTEIKKLIIQSGALLRIKTGAILKLNGQ